MMVKSGLEFSFEMYFHVILLQKQFNEQNAHVVVENSRNLKQNFTEKFKVCSLLEKTTRFGHYSLSARPEEPRGQGGMCPLRYFLG